MSTGSSKSSSNSSSSAPSNASMTTYADATAAGVPLTSAGIPFANDGSFLANFKKMQEENEEKKKKEEALQRKRELDERLKNRGKRKPEGQAVENKKPKVSSGDAKSNAYLEEVKKYQNDLNDGKDRSARPLVK